jgi:hypothetical protein
MAVALESSALDMAFQPSLTDSVRLKSDPKFQIYNNNQLGQYFLLTVAHGPAADEQQDVAPGHRLRDRPAALHRLDHARFAGGPRDLPWGESPGGKPPRTRDTSSTSTRPRRWWLVGVADPTFDLAYPLASFSGEYAALAQVIQSNLAQIGVKVMLKPTEIAAFTAAGLGMNPSYTGARLNAAAFTNVSEPTSHFILSSTFGSAINQSAWYDDAYKSLIQSTATQTDAAKRKEGYSQITDYLWTQAYCQCIGIPTSWRNSRPCDLGYPGPAVDATHHLVGVMRVSTSRRASAHLPRVWIRKCRCQQCSRLLKVAVAAASSVNSRPAALWRIPHA